MASLCASSRAGAMRLTRSLARCSGTVVGFRTQPMRCQFGHTGPRSRVSACSHFATNSWTASVSSRHMSSGKEPLTEEQLRRRMETFNDLFADAREEIDMSLDSKDTVYFNEEAEAAKEAVESALAFFEETLASVDEQKRQEIMRGSGLKVEQLKAELAQLFDQH